jgi:hypothetical protein
MSARNRSTSLRPRWGARTPVPEIRVHFLSGSEPGGGGKNLLNRPKVTLGAPTPSLGSARGTQPSAHGVKIGQLSVFQEV